MSKSLLWVTTFFLDELEKSEEGSGKTATGYIIDNKLKRWAIYIR